MDDEVEEEFSGGGGRVSFEVAPEEEEVEAEDSEIGIVKPLPANFPGAD